MTFAALVTIACAFTPNLAPLGGQHVAPRAAVQQRVAAAPFMRGWQDPWEDGMRNSATREKLETVRSTRRTSPVRLASPLQCPAPPRREKPFSPAAGQV